MLTVIGVVALALLLLIGLSGFLGGSTVASKAVETADIRLTTSFPAKLRNGEIFEMRISITPKRDIDNLRLAFDMASWRDVTINSLVPAPTEERGSHGRYLFDYGPVAKGESFAVKIDGQINPPRWGNSRAIFVVYDGDSMLAAEPFKMTVMP